MNEVLDCVDKKCARALSFILMSCTYTLIHARYAVQDNSPVKVRVFLKDYSLNVERRFESANDPESYAGGSVSCLVGQRVGVRGNGDPGPRGWDLSVGLKSLGKNLLLRNHGGIKE